MIKNIITKLDAAQEWVREFNAIDQQMISELMQNNIDDWHEVTKPSVCDRVYIYDKNESGKITDIIRKEDDDYYYTFYEITLDNGEIIKLEDTEDFEIEHDSLLPMWGTMWSFEDSADEYWLEDDNAIEIMSECGFRIYHSETYGYFFGIDGAGYNFYEVHWLPLYEKRGLQWHDQEK